MRGVDRVSKGNMVGRRFDSLSWGRGVGRTKVGWGDTSWEGGGKKRVWQRGWGQKELGGREKRVVG